MKFTSILAVTLAFVVVAQAVPTQLTRRRFSQEHTPAAESTYRDVRNLSIGTGKEAQAGDLSGAMVRALLAKAPTCDQQDRADEIIDLGQSIGGKKVKQYIEVAKRYRQLERNTPKEGQPSALCTKPPRHKELKGLVQAQDPTGKEKGKGKKKSKSKCETKVDQLKKEIVELKKQLAACQPDCKSKPPPQQGKNYAETNPVGGVKMPKIQKVNGDFVVNGNKFNGDLSAAHNRQCDIQHNLCFNKFNAGDRSFTGEDCEKQNPICKEGPPVFAN